MASTEGDTRQQVESEATDDKLTRLAQRLGASASAAAVFGSPVERDGITVIPVARVRWGLGGGTGKGKKDDSEGSGMGGGVQAAPMGYIDVRDGEAQYRRINDPLRLVLAILILPLSLGMALVMVLLTLALMARRLGGALSGRRASWPGLPNVVPARPWWLGFRGRRDG